MDLFAGLTIEGFLKQNLGLALLLAVVAGCYLLYKLKDAVKEIAISVTKEFNAIRLEWVQFNANQSLVVQNLQSSIRTLDLKVTALADQLKKLSDQQEKHGDQIEFLQNVHIKEGSVKESDIRS